MQILGFVRGSGFVYPRGNFLPGHSLADSPEEPDSQSSLDGNLWSWQTQPLPGSSSSHKKLLDVICTKRPKILISISTDKEPGLMSHVLRVATLFEHAAFLGVHHIWCDLHQLDVNLHAFCDVLVGKQFFLVLDVVIGCLRRYLNLINRMRTRYCTLAETS